MTRILSAVILGSIVIYIIAAGPVFLGAAAVLAVALAASHEMYNLVLAAGGNMKRFPSLAAGCLVVVGAFAVGLPGLAAAATAGFTFVFTWAVLAGETGDSVLRLSGAALLLLYPAWSLSHLVLYLQTDTGRRALLFVVLCVWICDSFAFYTGSAFGRRKLAPSISPNKTVVGAVGGTLGAVAAAVLLKISGLVSWSAAFAAGSGLLIAVLGQFGDLAESLVKRDAGVKDSGSVIPGHGGLMDRVDALLFAVPVYYYIIYFTGGLV